MISLKTLDICYEIISELNIPDTLSYLRAGGCDIDSLSTYTSPTTSYRNDLIAIINEIDEENRIPFVLRIIQTSQTLRNSISPRYRFDERWKLLNNSLLLDGYAIENNQLIEQDAIISEIVHSDDILYEMIERAELPEVKEILAMLKRSKDHFISASPDYNACLVDVRTPLETIIKNIANCINEFGNDKKTLTGWGNCLSYLRGKEFITLKDEKLISDTYKLLSELHRPVYISEKEMTRYARSLGLNAIWYIVNIYIAFFNADSE